MFTRHPPFLFASVSLESYLVRVAIERVINLDERFDIACLNIEGAIRSQHSLKIDVTGWRR